MNNAALISVDEIADSWLLKNSKTHHSWYKILPLVCEAVQELGFTSMPILRHTQITKLPSETWFNIPNGYADWVSVGYRVGNRWIPVGVTKSLMAYPNTELNGAQFNQEYDNKFKKGGNWKSWLNRDSTFITDDFFADDYSNEDYSDSDTTVRQPSPYNSNIVGNCVPSCYDFAFPFGWGLGIVTNQMGESVMGRFSNAPRPDEVMFNVEKGIIMCPDNFPSNELYLVYVGFGVADTMTYIPLKAQAVIEAYVSWKYNQNKRNNLSEARYFKQMYDEQHYLYRARNNELTTTVVRRIVDMGYIRDVGWIGEVGFGNQSQAPVNVTYYNYQFKIYTVAQAGTYVIAPDLVGKQISYCIVSGVYKDTGFEMQGNLLAFTDGTEFIGGEKIIVYYA